VWVFGVFFPVLVCCAKKNLATLIREICCFAKSERRRRSHFLLYFLFTGGKKKKFEAFFYGRHNFPAVVPLEPRQEVSLPDYKIHTYTG
jgi:hypothetical protein